LASISALRRSDIAANHARHAVVVVVRERGRVTRFAMDATRLTPSISSSNHNSCKVNIRWTSSFLPDHFIRSSQDYFRRTRSLQGRGLVPRQHAEWHTTRSRSPTFRSQARLVSRTIRAGGLQSLMTVGIRGITFAQTRSAKGGLRPCSTNTGLACLSYVPRDFRQISTLILFLRTCLLFHQRRTHWMQHIMGIRSTSTSKLMTDIGQASTVDPCSYCLVLSLGLM
jgi:hypothetical protein